MDSIAGADDFVDQGLIYFKPQNGDSTSKCIDFDYIPTTQTPLSMIAAALENYAQIDNETGAGFCPDTMRANAQ